MSEPVYKRVLIKISGEALAAKTETGKSFGLDPEMLDRVAENLKIISDMGVEIAIVVGGGNFWRGAQNANMDRTRADHIGMLATVMNSLALADALEQHGMIVRVQTAIEMRQDCRAVYQKQSGTPFGKGKNYDFRLRHGKSIFYDGYCRCAACRRNRSRCDSAGEKCRRRI